MSYRIEIRRSERMGLVHLEGFVDADQLEEAGDALTSADGYEPDFDALWDLRYTSTVAVGPEDMDRLVQMKLDRDERLGLRGRIAIVVNRHTVAGAALLAKVRGSREDGRVIDVFPSEREALAWLRGSEDSLP